MSQFGHNQKSGGGAPALERPLLDISAPSTFRPRSTTDPQLAIEERISLDMFRTVPTIHLRLHAEESQLIRQTKLPADAIKAFQILSELFPNLVQDYASRHLYDEAIRLQSQPWIAARYSHLSRAAHRFMSHFNGKGGSHSEIWRKNLGTPFALRLSDGCSHTLALCPATKPPLIRELGAIFDTSLTELARDYFAAGRVQEYLEAEEVAKSEFDVFCEAVRLRQLGFTNQEASKAIKKKFGVTVRPEQITYWVTGAMIPQAVRSIMSEVRYGKGSTIHIPNKASAHFSYLLGIHAGSARFDSTPDAVAIQHRSAEVAQNVQRALKRVGFRDVPIHKTKTTSGEPRYLVRVRSVALTGFLYELTNGHTQLPWPYLVTPGERRAFLRGITDSIGVVGKRRVTFSKARGDSMLEELAVLLADLGVYAEVSRGEKSYLFISTLPELRKFQEVLGQRYPEFDARLQTVTQSRGKHQISVAEYQAFEKVRDQLNSASGSEISAHLQHEHNISISEPVIRRWLKGERPPCMTRVAEIAGHRKRHSHIDALVGLVKKQKVPRSQAIGRLDLVDLDHN